MYSSDLYRAMYTASALCLPKGLPLHTDVRFREVHVGPWEELPFGTAWRQNPKEMDDFTFHPDQWRLEGSGNLPAGWRAEHCRTAGNRTEELRKDRCGLRGTAI